MLVKPENLKFETQNDVINYVSKGIPPMRKDFDQFIKAVGDSEQHGNGPYIPSGILKIDSDEMKEVLHAVQKNNRRNTLIGECLIAGSLLIGIGIGCIFAGKGDGSNGKEEKVNEDIVE